MAGHLRPRARMIQLLEMDHDGAMIHHFNSKTEMIKDMNVILEKLETKYERFFATSTRVDPAP